MIKIVYKTILVGLFVVIATATTFAHTWQPGNIHLKDGRVLSGKLHYQKEQKSVLYLSNNGIQTYPATLIQYFEFPDRKLGDGRIFYSLPANTDESDQNFDFFEAIVQGRLTLLHRQILTRNRRAKGSSLRIKADQFYYWKDDGTSQLLGASKKNLLRLMEDQRTKVQSYIKVHHLHIRRKAHLREIFEFYNSLGELRA